MNAGIRDSLHELYEGQSARAVRFRYGLLALDLVVVLFIVITSFFPHGMAVEAMDAVFGLIIAADLAARLAIAKRTRDELLQPWTLADIIVIVSLLAPLAGENLAFLRVVRALRVLRSYHLIRQLRRDSNFFRRRQDAILATVNLAVFIFLMTALVYETQHYTNPGIKNYADALYFTVTTLTTTGFGDITLQGAWGRVLSILIMVFGVTLFVRLVQVLFRAPKVAWRCPDCGLGRHDADAIHCKDCGAMLHMPHGGDA